MNKEVKIVVGANYGDEGKGLMTRHFALDAQQRNLKPVVIFHNGTAQRGHTVDYTPESRHVYHHFCSGTADGVPTYFAKTFLIHPMEFHRELTELMQQGIIPPKAIYDPDAKVITPLDMVVDHATEEWIARLNGEREFGSCGFGSWCAAEDRIPMGHTNYTIQQFLDALFIPELFQYMMNQIWAECLGILQKRGVDIQKTSFSHLLNDRSALEENFKLDLRCFQKYTYTNGMNFNRLYATTIFDSFIFENGQGLGLDMHVNNNWHTTSKTGITNPASMLEDKTDFNAEVCYVTRSYLTRHGVGPLEESVQKKDINADMEDKTNVHNEFQGSLRYGYLEDQDQAKRIITDYAQVENDPRYKKTMAVTHTNEFNCENNTSEYVSDNPYNVKERE